MPLWLGVLGAGFSIPSDFSARDWHLHEMVFGYVPAVVAGFLLTAIPNWTGRLPVLGWPLAMLWLLWFGGRVAVTFSSFAPVAAAFLDSSFLVVFSIVIWREILSGKNARNLPICIIISLFALANMIFHYQHLMDISTQTVERLALGVIAMLLSLVGGRITPSFTLNWMRKRGMSPLPPGFVTFDKIALVSVAFAVIGWLISPDTLISGWLFAFAAVMSLARLARWRGLAVISEPLLFVLHLGKLWVAVWLALMAAATLLPDLIDQTSALHALTAGAVGTMTLAVMTRASLGHAGRPLKAGFGAISIYALVITGSVIRICANWLPFDYANVINLSGILWSMGFLLFVILWAPMLVQRRKD